MEQEHGEESDMEPVNELQITESDVEHLSEMYHHGGMLDHVASPTPDRIEDAIWSRSPGLEDEPKSSGHLVIVRRVDEPDEPKSSGLVRRAGVLTTEYFD